MAINVRNIVDCDWWPYFCHLTLVGLRCIMHDNIMFNFITATKVLNGSQDTYHKTHIIKTHITKTHIIRTHITRHISSRHISSRHISSRHISSRYISSRHISSRHIIKTHIIRTHITKHISSRHISSSFSIKLLTLISRK